MLRLTRQPIRDAVFDPIRSAALPFKEGLRFFVRAPLVLRRSLRRGCLLSRAFCPEPSTGEDFGLPAGAVALLSGTAARNHRPELPCPFPEPLSGFSTPELQSGGLSHRCLRSCASFRSNLAEPAPEPEPGPLFVPGPLNSPQKRWFIRLSGYLCLMKITILGPAHPYRGGLASIMEIMARTFQRRGAQVDIRTFTLQYPALLFPGQSQTLTTPPPEDLHIVRCVNTVNPFNWLRVGRLIRRERPDFVLMKYWTPFMAPCFGTIARIARGNGHTKVLCQIDNVEPHEHHLTDKPFNRYYLHSVDGFVYMSEQVHRELEAYTAAPALFSPHPLFENFGERVDRREACVRLGLDPACRYVLFFGLVRDYKGLDLLLDAWALLRRAGRTAGRRLIVAGEFYTSKGPYLRQIAANGLADEVILHDYFIPDERVKYYFSAADFVVQPYKTATQSGVTQIAYQFCVPMVVTRVGGLAEIVPDGRVGYVCEPTAQGVADAIERMYADGVLGRFRENCVEERRRFSWEEMCSRIVEVYRLAADR